MKSHVKTPAIIAALCMLLWSCEKDETQLELSESEDPYYSVSKIDLSSLSKAIKEDPNANEILGLFDKKHFVNKTGKTISFSLSEIDITKITRQKVSSYTI